ncbi:dermatan-sulfate isomerase family protein [Abortiporus biennis]
MASRSSEGDAHSTGAHMEHKSPGYRRSSHERVKNIHHPASCIHVQVPVILLRHVYLENHGRIVSRRDKRHSCPTCRPGVGDSNSISAFSSFCRYSDISRTQRSLEWEYLGLHRSMTCTICRGTIVKYDPWAVVEPPATAGVEALIPTLASSHASSAIGLTDASFTTSLVSSKPTSSESHSVLPASSSSTSSSLSLSPTFQSTFAVTSSSSTPNATATNTSSSSPSSQPVGIPDPTTLADIRVMTERRLTFIVSAVNQVSSIASWLSTLGPDGKWPDSEVDYTAGCAARPAQSHWIRLLTMTAAWHGGPKGASQWTNDTTLLSAISSAMDFWFSNDFTNLACLDSGGTVSCPCGTPGFWNTNWFSNIILVPNLVSQTCLVLNDTLTDDQHTHCTTITGRTYGTFGHSVHNLGIATGANLLDIAKIGIDQGLLNLNVSIITDAFRRIHNEVVIENATMADGIRADGSFGQHGGVLYNGNYGKDFTNDVLFLEIEARGTQFAAGDTPQSAFSTLIAGDLWMIYRNVLTGVLHWDFSALGRFISFPVIDAQATGSININITEFEQLGEEWNEDTLTSAYSSLSKNTSNANVGSIVGNKMFYTNDYMVQRGPGYVTTVKMYSNRTKNTECLNAQNPLGFHLSDGTVYTYLQGNEYEDIAAAWDWNLIPGITVDYGATPLSCAQAEFIGSNAFVGGVSTGKIGLAAMRFTNPLTNALTWQKAWFFLDNDAQHVMIPLINSTSNSSIFSVLDQKRHSGPILVDGIPTSGNTNVSLPLSLWHDNIGYTFDTTTTDTSTTLSIETGPKTGNWSAIGISTQPPPTVDLFAAWLNHGSGPTFTPISYTTFPAVDPISFLKKSFSTRLRTIQNDADVSAVFDEVHRTAMFVFWSVNGGSATFKPSPIEAEMTVSVDGNAAVIYALESGSVTASDPSQTLASLNVTISASHIDQQSSKNWGPKPSKHILFALPSGGLAGSSVSAKL